jgi:hypothetical protein
VTYHEARCTICRHPERGAIEEEFTHWMSPWSIADEYDVDRRAIYRHAHAMNLFPIRDRNLRFALGHIIDGAERVAHVPASAIIQSVRAFTRINPEGQWVDPPAHVIVSSGSRPPEPGSPDSKPSPGRLTSGKTPKISPEPNPAHSTLSDEQNTPQLIENNHRDHPPLDTLVSSRQASIPPSQYTPVSTPKSPSHSQSVSVAPELPPEHLQITDDHSPLATRAFRAYHSVIMRKSRNRLPFLLLFVFTCALLMAQLAAIGRRHSAQAAAMRAARRDSTYDVTLGRGYRFDRGGWTYVHLEGAPHDIGVQHGYLMAPEIADFYGVVRLEMTHNTSRSWDFFRRAGREMLWPKIDAEYQEELQGITDGLTQHGLKLDLWDVVAMNAFAELPDYYVPWLNEQTKAQTKAAQAADRPVYGHCSAFVATGSWTKDHRIVMAHNNWTTYVEGARWKMVFDIVPRAGYRVLMDGLPGIITSDDDFAVNSGGLMVTETTIARFHGWDPSGKPEFFRSRKAMQYAGSIDDFEKIMLDGNNGGYANDWLLGDRKTGEIARLELGLRHTKLWRTTDGYFAGSNFPSDPDVIKDDTTFNPNNPSSSPNARHARWDQLLNENKGKIDTSMAEIFLGDHYDTFTKTTGPNLRTLCGHGESSSEGEPAWDVKPYDPSGAVQGKVIDTRMAEAMTFVARIGHPCGTDFDAAKFLNAHHEYSWESPILEDMDSAPWTQFRIGEHASPLPAEPAAAAEK